MNNVGIKCADWEKLVNLCVKTDKMALNIDWIQATYIANNLFTPVYYLEQLSNLLLSGLVSIAGI